MDTAQYQAVKELFEAAMLLAPAQRPAYVKQHAPDAVVLAELERLLAASGDDEETANTGPRASGASPTQIGQYRILHELGRGGMGVVYLAVHEEGGVSRRVALKIVKLGLSTEEVVQRFNVERRLLSALNSSGIARMLDAGATPDGRPYFVMEHIDGQPIDRYCDSLELSIQERLELFRKVCAVVHFAHQNLIVHRDLKPSNILVTPEGEVKLLDFGIAKLLRPDLIGIPFATLPEARMMTPEYASPEQVRGEPIGVQSDVYSLGVLLYELMTGRRPYELTRRLREEVIRIICDVEPERPSVAMTKATEITTSDGKTRTLTPEEAAKTRGGAPGRIRRDLSGDLDNIVMMSLRKVARRRYESAEQLSRDVQSLLEGRPVIATADTPLYVLGKFVRRNRGKVAACTAVVLALAVGLGAAWWQWLRAEESSRRFEESSAAYSAAVDTFVNQTANDIRNSVGSLDSRKALATASLGVLDALKAQGIEGPEHRRARALALEQQAAAVGGGGGASSGDRAGALRAFRSAGEIWESFGPEDPDAGRRLVRNLVMSSEVLRFMGGEESLKKADDLCTKAGRLLGSMASTGMDDRRLRAEYFKELADVRFARKDDEGALAACRESLAIRRALHAEAADSENTGAKHERARMLVIGLLQQGMLRSKPELDERCKSSGTTREEDLRLALSLAEANRGETESVSEVRDVLNARKDLAELLRKGGSAERREEGRALMRSCVAEIEQLLSRQPTDFRTILDSGRFNYFLGVAEQGLKDASAARASYGRAAEWFRRAKAMQPDDEQAKAWAENSAKALAVLGG